LAPDREEKINAILQAAVRVLAEKGYNDATIPEISEAANVSRGILHYYFKDKEDLVCKVLTSITSRMVQSSLEGLRGRSAEEIAENVVNIHKRNLNEHPDFYGFLFEMWCISRRSKRIRKEFTNCQEKVLSAIKGWLENASEQGIIKISSGQSEPIAQLLMAITDGTAFELTDHPEKLDDKRVLVLLRKMILSVLKQ
jgi:TetR/AcrR family transcriptional regulator, fatty acid metabolism regulator protein